MINIMMRNVILSQAALVAPHMRRGRPRTDHTLLLEKMMLVLHTGMPWRSLNHCGIGPDFRSVHRHLMIWARGGVFEAAYRALFRLYRRRDRKGEYHSLDSSYVKNIFGRECTGRNPTDRGRLATKVSALVTNRGLPVSLAFFPANVSDYKTVRQTLKRRIPDAMPSKERIPLYADKGYDSRAVRSEVWQAGYIDRISKRRVRLHRVVNRRRGVVERFFSWLDKERRLLMRFDTTIVAYAAWTWLACCKIMSKRLGQERAASKL